MKLINMLGYKLVKEEKDNLKMVRIIGLDRPAKITDKTPDPAEMIIYDYDTDEKKKVRVSDYKDYSPIKPEGILSFNIATVTDNKGKQFSDIIVTGIKYVNVEVLGANQMPYCVCRQNITDIFYNLLSDGNKELVGLSVNQETCPSNFDYRYMLACDNIIRSEFVYFYRTDTLDYILDNIKIKLGSYDEVLKGLYTEHVKAVRKPELNFKNEHDGWCKNLKTLLKENNFQEDINQMLGITKVDFDIDEFKAEKDLPGSEEKYYVARDDLRYWLSSIYKVNMSEVALLEYDHDINIADFNNNRYLLLRDSNDKLWLAIYTIAGEYYEADLEAKAKELDFSTKFRIKFYNKYNENNK